MNKLLKTSLFALLLLAATAGLAAQNFGYVNSAALLAEMPEVRAAEADLEALQTQLQRRGQTMVEEFQTDVAEFQAKVEAGELSPLEQQTQASALETRQVEIQQFEQKMVNDLQEKRAELLEPIYERVNTAIQEVAAEGEYTFIFDQQILLYGEESQDVSTLVKAKLGL